MQTLLEKTERELIIRNYSGKTITSYLKYVKNYLQYIGNNKKDEVPLGEIKRRR